MWTRILEWIDRLVPASSSDAAQIELWETRHPSDLSAQRPGPLTSSGDECYSWLVDHDPENGDRT